MKRFLLSALVACAAACSDHTTDPAVIGMRFVSLPATVPADAAFSATVELLGPDGERTADLTLPVTLSLVGAGTLTGTTTVNATAGLATFEGLRVSAPPGTVQLKASAEGVQVTSAGIRTTDACEPSDIAYPLSFSGTLAGSACTVDGKPAAFYRFTKPDFGLLRVTATASEGSAPEIGVLNSPPSDFIPAQPTGAATTGVWFLPAAPYVLRVRASSATGQAFAISSSAQISGCNTATLLPFAFVIYSGVLRDACNNTETYHLYSPQPCAFLLRGSATVDALLLVRNARTKELVAQDDNSGGGTAGADALLSLGECRSGTDPIEIVASSVTPATGTYALTVQITGGVSLFSVGRGAER